MKSQVIVSLLLLLFTASPVLAGHGFIEERDDSFYVEYTGDPGDKAADVPVTPSAAAKVAAIPPTPDQIGRREANNREAEISRAAREARMEARAASGNADMAKPGTRAWRKSLQSQARLNPE